MVWIVCAAELRLIQPRFKVLRLIILIVLYFGDSLHPE